MRRRQQGRSWPRQVEWEGVGRAGCMGPHVQPPAHCPCLPLTVSIRWIVVEDGASGPVVTTQHDEVALVIGGAAEAAVASRGETAVLGRARAEVTVQYPRVHQYDGHVALCQVRLDVLHTHCAVGGRRVSRCFWTPLPISLVELWSDPCSALCHTAWGHSSSSLHPKLLASGNILLCYCGPDAAQSQTQGQWRKFLSVPKDKLALSDTSPGGKRPPSRASGAAHGTPPPRLASELF